MTTPRILETFPVASSVPDVRCQVEVVEEQQRLSVRLRMFDALGKDISESASVSADLPALIAAMQQAKDFIRSLPTE